MFARIGSWQGSREELEQWVVHSRDEVKPNIRNDSGLTAAYWLVNRDDGKGLIITLWDSKEAMQRSEQSRVQRQSAMSGATGASVNTDRYEVVDSLMM